MTYEEGLMYASEKGYLVEEYKSHLKSFSGVIGHTCAIAINHDLMEPGEEKTALFHELGHCETGSFYNQYTPFEIREKHEKRADKWAIQMLIPKDELESAVKNGYTEVWDLAEYFNVTYDFMEKAIMWYSTGSLSA